MRRDLVVSVSHERKQTSYVVKDPLSLQYFQFSPVELFVLEQLDGKRTWQRLLDEVHERFQETRFEIDELKQFVTSLIGANLLLSPALGHGKILAKRVKQRQHGHARWLSRLNILTHRWRGVDPNGFLKWLDRHLGWIFTKATGVFFLTLLSVAILTFVIRVSSTGFDWRQVQAVFTVQNLPILMFAVIGVKALHELGHGLACVHYGGECHELGLLFIAFCPLPYCDTSDSWLHESRWNRALVAGAGILVEVLIASLCCLLWVSSVPGVLNLFLLNIMIICSVNTLLVNGNPLLRYDGYYVLSDALSYPNLGPDSRQLASQWFDRLLFGATTSGTAQFDIKKIPIALFGTASGLYRLFVMVMILWAVHQLLKTYKLESLTLFIAFPMIAGILATLMVGVLKRGRRFARQQEPKARVRSLLGLILFLGGVAGLLLYPFPYSTKAPFVLEPGTCKPVFVTVPGRLVEVKPPFSDVQAGMVIARLENSRITQAVQKTESELAIRELHLENLQRFRSRSSLSQAAIPTAEKSLDIARERFQAEQLRESRLIISAPVAGKLFPARNEPAVYNSEQKNRFWNGSPLDESNLSAWMQEQTLLGWVGESNDFQAVIYIPQHQMEFIAQNARTELIFSSAANQKCVGEVIEIGSERVQQAPRELFMNNLIVADPKGGQYAPQNILYRVRVRIRDGNPGPLYSTGFSKIECQPMSLFYRFWRVIVHAFALDL